MSSLRPSTVIAATVGAGVLGFLSYAIYFDHRRRTDPEFRRALKRDSRRDARIVRTQAEADAVTYRNKVKAAVDAAKAEGFPTDMQEREAYFMEQVKEGDVISSQPNSEVEAALCFYKALKVYHTPSDLISIYDSTVAKPVLDVLADMIAHDPSISVRGFPAKGSRSGSSNGSNHGVDD